MATSSRATNGASAVRLNPSAAPLAVFTLLFLRLPLTYSHVCGSANPNVQYKYIVADGRTTNRRGSYCDPLRADVSRRGRATAGKQVEARPRGVSVLASLDAGGRITTSLSMGGES